MAGLAETRGNSADTFWTWRETMYRFALEMTPEDTEAVATLLYVEMLEQGYTRVGEFHYLHHDRDGAPYGNPAEMGTRIVRAAEISGIGLTLLLIGLSEFVNRLTFGTPGSLPSITPFPLIELLPVPPVDVLGLRALTQYGLTYVAFLVVVPVAWWLLTRTSFGLAVRAVGENPEAADAAGISVARTRYAALMLGGALMGVGGAFFTLAALGTFTLDIIAGRGWVCIALVIFGRWRVVPAVLGALLFSAVYSLQLRLRIVPGWDAVPFELLLALPDLVVIAALALSGRNVAYPGAYLKPYRRA
jgi:ABC-type uncharacterized transport system permease subunit